MEAERVLLRRLSVCAGGWTLEAAEAVCADDSRANPVNAGRFGVRPPLPVVEVFDLLSRLVEKSLVVAEEESGEARYRMLETMRQYAREKLLESGETNAIRDRHLFFFLHLAEEAEPHLTGPAQAVWSAHLERDYANLRAALEWFLQAPDASLGMRLASALVLLWLMHGPLVEGADWLVRAVLRSEEAAPSRERANALRATARVLWLIGELVRSNSYREVGLALSRALAYQPGVARALFGLGVNARVQGDLKTSMPLLEQSLAIGEGLDSDAIALIYANLGLIAAIEGDFGAARKYFEQAMTVAQAAEDSHGVALPLPTLAHWRFCSVIMMAQR